MDPQQAAERAAEKIRQKRDAHFREKISDEEVAAIILAEFGPLLSDGFNCKRVLAWMRTSPRKGAAAAFTEGGERSAAYLVEIAEHRLRESIVTRLTEDNFQTCMDSYVAPGDELKDDAALAQKSQNEHISQ